MMMMICNKSKKRKKKRILFYYLINTNIRYNFNFPKRKLTNLIKNNTLKCYDLYFF